MTDLPAGTVTFLFTDLEGSTRLWEQFPEAMRPALERHDAILRDAVEAHGGVIVKTTGDGLHAVFTTVLSGVEAALTSQRMLAAERWPEEPGELRVRMGLHTGDAVPRGDDYYGPAVNRAARVMSAGNGGQVLLSLVTSELVREFLPDGSELVDLGEHRLPDLARPEHLFQLAGAELRAEFPPLRTLDAMPGNLPRRLASFVGRARERDAIADAMETARLVTVTGVGGVGKSRLAVQVAADRARRYPGGVWLCDLSTVDNAGDLHELLVETFEVPPRTGVAALDAVCDALRSRQLLLLLDNSEHLLDATRDVADALLSECPGVHLLVTSREALGVAGEQAWPLRELDVPSVGATSVEQVAASSAARLFEERARAVQPGFAIDAGNAAVIGEICRRLDGIPLALELAAARVALMSPADIAARLDQRFNLLTGGPRGGTERHQTLRGAIEWSYEMLDPLERTLFERFSVFPGSYDADAGAAVGAIAGMEPWDVLDAGAGLVAKSLVVADDSSGTTRYRMLETIRTYARERLEEADAADATLLRHALHYVGFAEEAGLALLGADEIAWRGRVRLEFDNLRAALIRCLRIDSEESVALAVRLIAALSFEALNDPRLRIGQWAQHMVDRLDHATPAQRTAILAAAALRLEEAREGDAAQRLALAQRALVDGVPEHCPSAVLAFIVLVSEHMRSGDVETAVAILDDAVAALRAAGNEPTGLSMLHGAAASFHTIRGDQVGARVEAELALEAARRSRNPSALASAQFSVALAMWAEDRVVAVRALDDAIRLAQGGVAGGLLGYALGRRAVLRADRRDVAGAVRDVRDAIRQADDRGDHPMLTTAIECAMAVLEAADRPEATLVLAGSFQHMISEWVGRTLDFGLVNDLDMVERVRRARSALGDAAAGAQARGRTLALEDAVAFARAELEQVAAELAAAS
jgi:predicted ATPase/class 3 adenylate cyclase